MPETTLENQYFAENRDPAYVDPVNDIPSVADLLRSRNIVKAMIHDVYIILLKRELIKGLKRIAWASLEVGLIMELKDVNLILSKDLLEGEPTHIKEYVASCLGVDINAERWTKELHPLRTPKTMEPIFAELKQDFEAKGWIFERMDNKIKISAQEIPGA